MEVRPSLFKQELCISDASATAQLMLWQDSIGTLWLTDATLYKDFQVRSFDQKKYLSPLKAGFSVTPEEDIRDVKEPTAEEEEKNELLNDVHVVGARVASLLLNFPDSRFTTSKFY